MNKKRKRLIRYIDEKVRDCGIECKIDILNTIAIDCGQNIIWEEGTGCRILFHYITEKTLNIILCRIDEDLLYHAINFDSLNIPDGDILQ